MSSVNSAEASQGDRVTRFHRELTAAVLAGVPIELGEARLLRGGMTGTLPRLHSLERVVDEQISRGQTLTQVIDSDSNNIPNRYRAAFRLFERTAATDVMLDGLATRLRCRHQLARLLRSSLLYLMVVLFVAATLMSFFSDFIVPSFRVMRDDLQLVPAVRDTAHADVMHWLPTAVSVLEIIVYALFVLVILGASATVASWLGGHRYQTLSAVATALRAISALVSAQVPVQEAVWIGCNLVGNKAAVRKQIDAVTGDRKLSATAAGQLESWADHFQASAVDRLAVLRVFLPVTLVAVIGGGVTMMYGLAVFWPIITLLKDLSRQGI